LNITQFPEILVKHVKVYDPSEAKQKKAESF